MAFPTFTYTFTNGSTADATQVNQNFTDILNGISDTTKDISVAALTAAGTATLSGNIIFGANVTKTLTFNGSIASNVLFTANTTYNIGSATLGVLAIYIGGTSTFTTAIKSAATASWTLTLPTTAGTSGQVLQTNGSGTATWATATLAAPPANFLVNSAFDYWQAAGTSTTITATGGGSPAPTGVGLGYGPDQWSVNNILGGGTVEGIITLAQQAGVTNGSKFGAQAKITTAPTGTGIQNGCELWQTLSNRSTAQLYGQTASFTVLVKAVGNVTQAGVQFYYSATEIKAATSIGAEVLTTVSSGAFTSCTINGQALGTSMTLSGVVGVRIRITGVSSGNTYDINNGFTVEQASLNIGATASASFIRQHVDPVTELLSCNYFYCKTFATTTAPAQNAGFTGALGFRAPSLNGAASVNWIYPVMMRATPTIVSYSPNAASANWSTSGVTPTYVSDQVSPNSHQAGASTAMTLNNSYAIQLTADARF